MSDVKLLSNAVIVEGNMGVGTVKPVRPLHAESEVHVGGPSGGYSFADRHKSVFMDLPQNAERWVLYAADEAARLWSGEDVLIISKHAKSWRTELKGDLVVEDDLEVGGTIRGMINAQVSSLSGKDIGPTIASQPGLRLRAIPLADPIHLHTNGNVSDPHIALFHDFSRTAPAKDTLVLNYQGTYKSGVRVDGNVQVTGVITQSSSAALKENVAELTSAEAISALQRLNPVKFNYKADEKREQHIGFIAEEVPELVAKAGRTAVSPMDIVAVLTTVVQDMQTAITRLSAKVDELTSAPVPAEVTR